MKSNLPLICLALFTPVIITSCVDKELFNNINVKPNTTIPIGTAVISDSTLFAMANVGEQLFIDPNGVINFTVNGNYQAINSKNINQVLSLKFDPYDFAFNIPLPPSEIPFIPVPDNTTQSYYMNYSDGTTLDLLQLTQGEVVFTIENPNNLDYSKLICTIPQITKNGQALTIKPGERVHLDKTFTISPDEAGGLKNRISIKLSGTIPYAPKLAGVVKINDAELFYAKGFFGHKEIAKQILDIEPSDPAFSNLTEQANYIYFANPLIKFNVGNDLNIPVLIDISSLAIDGQTISLKPTLGAQKFLVKAKSTTPITISNESTTSGTALSAAITKHFKSISIGISTSINPTTEEVAPNYTPNQENTIANTDTLGIAYDVRLPFDCILDKLPFVQEIGIDLSDMADNKNTVYENFQMRFTGTNELPVKLLLNPYITSDNDPKSTPIYLLDKPVTIEPTSSTNRPGSPLFAPYVISAENAIIVTIKTDKIEELLRAKKIFLELVASTRNAQEHNPSNSATLFSPSLLKLDIVFGAKATINITPKNK